MFEDKINQYADKHGIPRDIAMRQVAQESSFNPRAVSKAGAAGLLQLMPGTAAELGLSGDDRFDPDKNLDAGFRYLAQQVKANKGNMHLALAGFNAGPGNVRKYNGIPPFPETQDYVARIMKGKNAPATATTPQLDPAGLPIQANVEAAPKQTALEKRRAYLAKVASDPVLDTNTKDTTLADATAITDAMNSRNLAGLEAGTASAAEAFEQGFQDNVTGALWDAFALSGELDPEFNKRLVAGDKTATLDAQQWGQDLDLRGYVLAANNEVDFDRRMEVATTRAQFSQKMQNTGGWDGLGVGASQFIGNMADPVAITASLLTGGLGGSLMKGAALGMAENVAAGIAVDSLQNRDTQVADVLLNASMGAVLGGIGGTWEARSTRRRMEAGEEARMGELMDEANAMEARLTTGKSDIEGEIMATMSPEDEAAGLARAMDTGLEGEFKTSAEGDYSVRPSRGTIRSDNPFPDDASTFGYDTNPATNGVALSDDGDYRKLGNHGIVREVNNVDDLLRVSPEARRLGIASDARAVYLPAEDRVYMIRGNIPKGTDMRGLIMHETGVHHGLERFVGGERFNEIMDVIATSDDVHVRAARRAVPEDTPMWLRMEEALGYFVENNPTNTLTTRIVSTIRNALRENVPMFGRMKITTADTLEYVRGSVKRAAKEGRVSRDRTGFVWQGSPTKGIDQIDTAFIGTGEGNLGFAWGAYTSSARTLGIRYRDTLTRQRGMRPEDGGLYQMKLLADPRDMLSWEGIVTNTHAAQNLKGDLAPMAGETGEVYYNRMVELFGSKKAASEALDDAGVPGMTHFTGDSRSRSNGWRDNNFVLFHNRHLDMAARYSRPKRDTTGAVAADLASTIKEDNFNARADVWDDIPTAESKAQREKTAAWYATRPEFVDKHGKVIDSPGLMLQKSQSKRARFWGAHILEDATGLGKRVNDTSAMVAVTTSERWRHATIPQLQTAMLEQMTTGEKIAYATLGSQKGMNRISYDVELERQMRREALKKGGVHTSTASPGIQGIADQLDAFTKMSLGEARTAKVEQAAKSLNSPGGHVGFLAYKWDYQELNRLRVEDIRKYNNIIHGLKTQYRENILTEAMQKLTANGAVTPAAIQALMVRVTGRVDHLVSIKMKRLMDDPESRIRSNEADLSNIAEELLAEKYHGDVVTIAMADQFKKDLADILSDTSRTEMDLVTQYNGTRLLDVINHDAIGQVESAAQQYSGLIGLSKQGVRDRVDADAILDSLKADGATLEEIEALDFGFRALGLGNLRNGKEAKWATALRDGAHMAMMGKLSLSLLAELPMVASVLGLAAVVRNIPRSVVNGPLMRQMAILSPSLAGIEHRLNTLHGVELGQREQGMGAINNLLRRGRQATDHISMANAINVGMHRAFVPVAIHQMMEGVLRKGGLSPEKLSDIGLSKELADRIGVQVARHDPNYKLGAELNIERWGQYEADQFLLAANRMVSQIMTRAHVGERPMWHLESDIGAAVIQFKGAGFVSAEKQTMRTVATNSNGALLIKGAMALMWGAMLYEAKLSGSTLGMTDKEKAEYLKKVDTPLGRTSGIFIYTNISGLMPDATNFTQMLLGGQAQGTSMVAGLGFLGKLQDAASAPVDLVTGDYKSAITKVAKSAPAGNTIPFLYMLNTMNAED